MAVCEGNLQGTQPKDRASSSSPRYEISHGKASLPGGLVRIWLRYGSDFGWVYSFLCRALDAATDALVVGGNLLDPVPAVTTCWRSK